MIPFITSLDAHVLQTLYAWRTPELVLVFSFLTLLGNALAITVVALAMAIVLWHHRRFEYKAGFAIALFGSLLSSYLIKIIVERPRPPTFFHLIFETGYSFPSMHATVSMATYGFLAFMTWKLMRPPHHRLPWILFLCLLILLIGFSRMYLGVHYLSDVMGGFAVGAVWLWFGIRVTQKIKSRAAS